MDLNIDTQWQFSPSLSLGIGAAYTYQKAQDYSDPSDNYPKVGTYKGQIAYIPWHNGSLTANLIYKSWGLNYSFSYVGERYHTSANTPENYEKPWYTHDMGLTRSFTVGNMKLKGALEINNLLDHQYEVVLNYPMPGRNYKVKLTMEL